MQENPPSLYSLSVMSCGRNVALSKLPLLTSDCHVLAPGVHYEQEGVGMRGPPDSGVVDSDPPPPHTDCVFSGY